MLQGGSSCTHSHVVLSVSYAVKLSNSDFWKKRRLLMTLKIANVVKKDQEMCLYTY